MTSTPRSSVPLQSIIYVEPGSNVPFDGTIHDLSGRECFVDESLLTGESRMVRKEVSVIKASIFSLSHAPKLILVLSLRRLDRRSTVGRPTGRGVSRC
jgi:P-type E1-E2 ATPase